MPLTERGFIGAKDGDPRVTDDGRLLARIYSESDLLVAECLRGGAWEGLTPRLAGVLSAVLYDAGGDSPAHTDGPRGADRQAAPCIEPDTPVRGRVTGRRAAAPHRAEP